MVDEICAEKDVRVDGLKSSFGGRKKNLVDVLEIESTGNGDR